MAPLALSRRSFLAATTSLAAAPLPPRVLGANDRLRVGVIGAGGNATGHMRALQSIAEQDNVEIVAVCDLFDKRLEAAAGRTGGKPYRDYRKLLEHKGLDYVTISVPEHWHAQITMDAADSGLHIYCEKPLTHSIADGLAVRRKIKETGVKLQVGVQGMSDDSYETAARAIAEGAIGKVVLAQIDYSRNHVGDFWTRPHDPEAQPGVNLDWKTFLGPAPDREWNPDRFFAWRRYWDYSGGIATDLFVHRLTRILKACGLTAPSTVTSTGGKYIFTDSEAEIPDTHNVLLEYPEGLTVTLVSSMGNAARIRHLIRGHKATLEFTKEGFTIIPEEEFADEVRPMTHVKSGGENMALHHHNLHNAIRLEEPLKCDVDLGFYASLGCQLANQSFREQRLLAWDPETNQVKPAA